MKVKVIGNQRPFFNTKLRKIGDIIDVDDSFRDNLASWMEPVRGSRKSPDKKAEVSETEA